MIHVFCNSNYLVSSLKLLLEKLEETSVALVCLRNFTYQEVFSMTYIVQTSNMGASVLIFFHSHLFAAV